MFVTRDTQSILYSTNKRYKNPRSKLLIQSVHTYVGVLPYNKNALAVEQLEESKSNIYMYI